MQRKIVEFFNPPVFPEEEKTRIAGHLFLLSKITLGVVCILLVVYPVITRKIDFDTLVLALLIPTAFIVFLITKKGHVRTAGLIYTVIAWLYMNYATLHTGGIRAVGFAGNLVVIAAAAVLISNRAMFAFGLASSLFGFGLAYLQTWGVIAPLSASISYYTSWVTQTATIVLLTGLLYIATDKLQLALNRSQNAERDVRKLNQELIAAYQTTLEGWARALELRDKETEGHSRRVVELTEQLALKMGVPPGELVHIRYGSLLHDIGKMGIPDNILRKPGQLTAEERKVVEAHPLIAYDLIKNIAYLQDALDIPYCHHEKWNGSGYPNGLQGDRIPLPARIFAVVDVWDALNHERPYRQAWPADKVVTYLKEQSGIHFDPKVVEVFLESVIAEGWDSGI